MKKVVKVSIGNLAFSVEEEGFLLIKGYLDELQDHYESNENGTEIIEGIEERMAELFVERSGSNTVVTTSVVKDVITVLGRPEAIFEEQSDGRSTGTGSYRRVQKRLYRNNDNKVIGGVCSGLAAYTSLDVTLVRVLFVILFIGFSVFGLFHVGGGSFMVLAYIIMWIIIPEARTVEQRCAMYGESVDLSDIQRTVRREAKKAGRKIRNEGSDVLGGIARVFTKVVAIALVIFSITGILALSFALLGVELFKDVTPVTLINYVEMGISNTLYLKIAFLAMIFLPLIGMLYGGIQLLFEFRSPRVRPGLVILLLWVASIISFSFMAAKASRPYWNDAWHGEELVLNTASDTIFIKFEHTNKMPKERVMLDGGYSNFGLLWMGGKETNEEMVIFPRVKIVKQSNQERSEVRSRTWSHAYTYSEALSKSQTNMPQYTVEDSLITIKPSVYTKDKKWDGTDQRMSIYIPKDKKVVVLEPIYHNFQSEKRMEWFKSSRWNNERVFERW